MKKLNYILASALVAFALVTVASCSNDEELPQSNVANTAWQWVEPTHETGYLPGFLSREERNLVLNSNGFAQMRDETCVWSGTDTLMHMNDYHHYTYTFNAAANKGVLSLYAMETYQGDDHFISYITKDYDFIYDPVNNKLTVRDSTVMDDGHKELVERVFTNVTFKQSEQPQLPETPALTFVAPYMEWGKSLDDVREYMHKNLPDFKEDTETESDSDGTRYHFYNKKGDIGYEYTIQGDRLVETGVNYFDMNDHFDFLKSQVSAMFDIWDWKKERVMSEVHWWSGEAAALKTNVTIGWSYNIVDYMYVSFCPSLF